MESFEVFRGQLPLLVSFPHSGTTIPSAIADWMTPAGRGCEDTDWWLPRLYDLNIVRQATQIRANFSRYVIDPNRPPDGTNLYPGQPTPELCPRLTFAGEPIYLPGCEPTAEDIEQRKELYWSAYHRTLAAELERLLDRFGFVVLFDAHSILSRVPRLFEGQLPDLNIGTNHGKSCADDLQRVIAGFLDSIADYSSVINGRFVGGYITRHYGKPDHGVHAVQLELAQLNYMNEIERTWDDEQAGAFRPVLEGLLQSILRWCEQRLGSSLNV